MKYNFSWIQQKITECVFWGRVLYLTIMNMDKMYSLIYKKYS